MFPFKKKKRRPAETVWVPKTKFLCEQDGIPERELKQSLIEALNKRSHVRSAYLARVEYDKPDEMNVALCIKMDKEDDPALRKEIGNIFAGLFGAHEHLDVLFLRDEQVTEIRSVCNAFYEN